MNTATVSQDAPAERPSGVWHYVSASRLSLWARCPLAFKFRYLDGIKTPTTTSLFLGQRVHHGLEIWHRHQQLGQTLETAQVSERMRESWDEAVAVAQIEFASAKDDQLLLQQAQSLVTTYLASRTDITPDVVAVETTLEAPLVDPATGENLGINALGVVDLVERDEGGSIVVDFKTAAKSSPPAEISHEVQLGLYSYLYRATTGQKEAGLEIRTLVKTKKPKVATYSYAARSESDYQRLFALVREYLDCLDRGSFAYRPGWSCVSCEFRDGPCRAWCR